jgi:hypothetical protein
MHLAALHAKHFEWNFLPNVCSKSQTTDYNRIKICCF